MLERGSLPAASVSVIIAAAGSASRMEGIDKQMLPLNGLPVLLHSILLFDSIPQVREIIVVARKEQMASIDLLCRQHHIHAPVRLVQGGDTRQQSCAMGAAACSPDSQLVAIHDGARPLVAREDVLQVMADAEKWGAAALGVPSKDTVKLADPEGFIASTPDRSLVWNVQTPQVFRLELYRSALKKAEQEGLSATDDCMLVEAMGQRVYLTRGSYRNLKITTPEDRLIAEALAGQDCEGKEENHMRIGHGYDVHRLEEGRKLILGGVEIPYAKGLLGHSDADVLAHAIMDALLGAAGLGDIGKHFPDSDPAYKGADSLKLLAQVAQILKDHHFTIENIDSTVIAQQPKLSPYLEEMKRRIAAACQLEPEQVNIKATTEERLGFTGRMEGLAAHAVALIR